MIGKKAVQIVGYKNSGKTHLILDLCSLLKDRGLKVGCIKYTHHNLDRIDSDTDKMTKESNVVVGLSNSNSQILFNQKKDFFEILSYMDVDVILVEGGKHEIDFLPRIVVIKDEKDMELKNDLTIGLYSRDKNIDNISKDTSIPCTDNVEILAKTILDRGYLLAGNNCGGCGYSTCRELGIDILKESRDSSSCVILNSPDINIEIDGIKLNLNPFVQHIVKSTIKGMLSPLKGYRPGDVVIKFRA